MAGKKPYDRYKPIAEGGDNKTIGTSSDPTRPISGDDYVVIQDASEAAPDEQVRVAKAIDIPYDVLGYVIGKNKYNKDKYPSSLYPYPSYINNVNANIIGGLTRNVTGHIPVTPGRTYLLWMNHETATWLSAPYFYSNDYPSASTKGVLATYTNYVMYNGNQSVKVTIPSTVVINSITVVPTHMCLNIDCASIPLLQNAEAFRSIVILEDITDENAISPVITKVGRVFEPYIKKLSAANIDFTDMVGRDALQSEAVGYNEVDNTLKSAYGKCIATQSPDGYLYVRSQFNATYDVVLKTLLVSPSGAQPITEMLIPKTNAQTDFTTGAILIKNSDDDGAPINVNGTYIGAGHGAAVAYKLTKTNHSLTYTDIGTVWADGTPSTPKEFAIVSIFDANNIIVVGKNTSATDVWTFQTSPAGLTFNEIGGSRIFVASSATLVQLNMSAALVPAFSTPTVSVIVNGESILPIGTPTYCQSIDVLSSYDILYPPDIRKYCVDNVGGFNANPSQAQFDNITNVRRFIKIRNRFKYSDFGTCVVDGSVELLFATSIGYIGFIQASAVNITGSETRTIYAPRIKSSVANVNKGIQAFASLGASWVPTSASLDDTTKWCDRIIQFVNNSGVKTCAFVHGYSEIANGKYSNRNNMSNTVWNIYTTMKSYPRVVDDKSLTLPAGTVIYATAYRKFYDPKLMSIVASSTYIVEMNGYAYLYVDYHSTVNRDAVVVPNKYAGKPMTVHDKTSNVTVHTDEYVPGAGILISCDCSAEVSGYAILRINL